LDDQVHDVNRRFFMACQVQVSDGGVDRGLPLAETQTGTVAGEAQDNKCNTKPDSGERRLLSATG
jgi:hypothetical protein